MRQLNRPAGRRSGRRGSENRGSHARPAARPGWGRPSRGRPRRLTERLAEISPEATAAAGVLALVALVLGGFLLGAARVSVRLGVWAAALGLVLIVASALLYAFRLRASGPPG